MEDQFVPYEIALKLKELGFDEPCFGRFRKTKFELNVLGKPHKYNSNEIVKGDISSPLWQQVFDWFREEKDLLNHLTTHLNTWGEDNSLETYYGYRIMTDKDGWKCDVWEKLSHFEIYEEAREACLIELIELIK